MAARFKTLRDLKKYLNTLGYKEIKDVDSRSVHVLTEQNRITVFNTLVSQLGGIKNQSRSYGGSLGHIDVGTYRIGVKPLKAQGVGSAGLNNEKSLVDAINYLIAQYGQMDILFTDGTHTFLCKQCKAAAQVGTDTTNRKKSDINIVSTSRVYPISLKKDNAEYWESADSLWKTDAKKYLTAAVAAKKVTVESIGGGKIRITPNVGIEATLSESKDVIFGSDILNRGCVITKTFDGSEFEYNGKTNMLTIKVSSVITKLSDVPESKKVWFLIRNDSTRNSIESYPGTRALASYKSRINNNVYKITVSER